MTLIAAILPCHGRPEQTVRNARRLITTAGRSDWLLIAVGGSGDSQPLMLLEHDIEDARFRVMADSETPQLTYWQALAHATARTDAPLIANLANDLLPGMLWIDRALTAYRARFGDGDGLLGFNDGIQGPGHSPHFLISRRLLERYGGWPIWYQHNYGDTELCCRAQQDGCYGKAPWAVLYHDHALTGAAHDAIYDEGNATSDRDRALFEERRQQGWPTIR